MLLDANKITVMQEIKKHNNVDLNILERNSVPKIVIFDGMVLVSIKKDFQTITCKDLAESFTCLVHHESERYDEVSVIEEVADFDKNSLREIS